ncbi:hypothetical protein [Galbibacter sp. PAP.153]|uniref:hypothetical protein n=1 Tax=Galbibacter sp. PAP.153 TaxID=3104623 RepID=UPI00300BC4E1
MFKTENGGISWEDVYSNSFYSEKAIFELYDDAIYITTRNGQIKKSNVEYDTVSIALTGSYYNIEKEPVILKGNVTSNGDEITDIKFLYGTDYSNLDKEISASTTTVKANQSINVTSELSGLEANNYYNFQLVDTSNEVVYKSEISSFYTPDEYDIEVDYPNARDNDTVELIANISSFNKKVTNIEFVYGTQADSLVYSISADSLAVGPGEHQVRAKLTGLMPDTQYYVNVKANYDGKKISGYFIKEFKTKPDYTFYTYSSQYEAGTAQLQAEIYAYEDDLKNISFEYGTSMEMMNSVVTSPSIIKANDEFNNYVNAEISGLDTNSTYFYRLKALQGDTYVYSEINAFNFNRTLSISNIEGIENEDNSVLLKGYIYPGYNSVSNIVFEYGLTTEYGNTLITTPDYIYEGGFVKAVIPGSLLVENTTYHFRLKYYDYNGENFSNDFSFTTVERYAVDEDNYKIEFTNETCLNKNNGTIKVTPIIVQNYEAIVNNEAHTFTNELLLENLEPGNYSVCLSIAGKKESGQCFEVQVGGAEEIAGKIESNKTLNTQKQGFILYCKRNGSLYGRSQ